MKPYLVLSIAAFAATSLGSASAQQPKLPSRAEVDKVLNNMVEHFNSNMRGTRVDEMTVIEGMAYDPKGPILSYAYSTTFFSSTGKKELEQTQAQAITRMNVSQTCSSPVRPLLSAYGLQVMHTFSDPATGKTLLRVRVTSTECARSR